MRTSLKITALILGITLFAPSSRSATKVISSNEAAKILSCAAPLVSHWVQEIGYAKRINISYGEFEIARTDVGSPDGELTISKGGKVICKLPLSLNPDIYLSSKDQVLVLSAYSGSNNWWKLYSLNGESCEALGETKGSKTFKRVKELLSESDGNRTCKKN